MMGKASMIRSGRILRGVLAAVVLAPLAACALADVAGGPAPSLYVLKAPAVDDALQGGPVPAQLVVEDFTAPAAIDTTRIVFQPGENEIAYYAGARWSDRAPRMISTLLVETLSRTGKFPAVVGPGATARMDYALVGDIRAFAASRDASAGLGQGTTKVRVVFYVRLLRARDRSIVASREFSSEAAAPGSGMANVVAAYDAALGAVLADIAGWTLEQSIAAGAGG
jgi:cholesterol transport system auxiliary component